MVMRWPLPDIEEFFRYATVNTFAINRDETKIAVATNLSGRFDVWEMRPPGFYPYPLTHHGQMIHDIRYDPQGRYLVVSVDHDGDETPQLYLVPPDGGTLVPLVTEPGRRHYLIHLSEDGRRVYYTSDKDNPYFLNSYVYDIEAGTHTLILQGEGMPTYLVRVAEDETRFVSVSAYANTHMVAFLHEGSQRVPLTPDPAVPHVVSDVHFQGPDTILLTTNYGSEYAYLARYRISDGTFEKIVDIPGEDMTDIQLVRGTGRLFVLTRSGVEDKLYTMDLDAPVPQRLALPVSVVSRMELSRAGNLYLDGASDSAPRNVYRRIGDGPWEPVTQNRAMGVSPERAIAAEIVRYRSFDGLEIEALWFAPPAEASNGHTIIWPHGGPQAAERRQFRSLVQFLCSRGYAFFAPNFRGSTGYGSAFARMVEGDWGGGPRLDMIAGIDWLIAEGRADRDRLFLMGGSYGGYMALLLHGLHGEYFRAVVDLFGPSNLLTFYHSVPDSWKPRMRQFVGDPETDRARFVEQSPITYADRMKGPLLVVQGANDPRVVQAESEQMVEALRERGVEVEYLVLPDEGHGFSKKDNEIVVYRKIVEFLDAHRALSGCGDHDRR